ncbi:MAG: hypothetical protein HY922_15240 [Elusimicrobia bacterium]|nr:hypothetical protein [Elusimicrobiota bacterium]
MNIFSFRDRLIADYAEHRVSERTGKEGYSPACDGRWGPRNGRPRKYLPLTDHYGERQP